jgi:hypothetical protein
MKLFRESVKFLCLTVFVLVFFPSLALGFCCPSSHYSDGTYNCFSECNGSVAGGACFAAGNVFYSDVGYLCKDSDTSKCFMASNTYYSSWTKDNEFPDTDLYNGNVCAIYSNSNPLSLTCSLNGQGVWDADDGGVPSNPKCVQCNGKVESKICGDTSSLSLGCVVAGNNKCESACPGMDSQDAICDELDSALPPGVSVAGGVCISCVFFTTSKCGDDQIEPPEICDGPDLGGQTCQNLGYTGGVLACKSDCTFDTSGCTQVVGPSSCLCPEGTCPDYLKGGLVPCGRICDDPDTPENECCPCTLCHLFVLLDKIVDFLLLEVVPPLAVLMLVIGGGMFLASTGNPELLTRGKKILTATVFALLIIYCSWIIINTILTFLGVANWVWPSGGWFQINCPLPGE